jgi:hypothetical protein
MLIPRLGCWRPSGQVEQLIWVDCASSGGPLSANPSHQTGSLTPFRVKVWVVFQERLATGLAPESPSVGIDANSLAVHWQVFE